MGLEQAEDSHFRAWQPQDSIKINRIWLWLATLQQVFSNSIAYASPMLINMCKEDSSPHSRVTAVNTIRKFKESLGRQNQINVALVNRDSGAALITNRFNLTLDLGLSSNTPFPYAMDVGKTLTGTLTPSEIYVRVQGFDSGQTRAFVGNIVAQRV